MHQVRPGGLVCVIKANAGLLLVLRLRRWTNNKPTQVYGDITPWMLSQ